ncbi:dTDP-6-deoxy-L-hexose 3-O-methyltransferase [Escherichia coli]|nr:dTDP-6-deoxy-L-hexose 3-O-methyltransferase [Escherichia coli]
MTTFTKDRLLTIQHWRETYGPGSNVVLPAEEAEELARIALASLEAEPVAKIIAHYPLGVDVGKQKFVQAIRELPDFGGYLFAAPPAPIVPEEMYWQDAPVEGSSKAAAYATGWNDCREAMLQSGNFRENKDSSTNNFRKIPEASTSSPVTPALLPGGFTIEEAKELHEDLVRSHISKALSGEKMKKKDRDADLRWIHGVIVQAAWFVKASLEQNALSGNYPVTPDSWISCSERMPEKGQNVLISVNFDSSLVEPLICSARYTGSTFRRGQITVAPGNGIDGNGIEQATHWMPLPEPPQEVNRG